MSRVEKYLLGLLAITPLLYGNPSGHTVVKGNVKIEAASGNHLLIHADDRAIIQWKDFSIASHEIAQFVQPSSKAFVLNRVIGGRPSEIMGYLKANGNLLLINQQGIVIGKGAVINTNGFIASSLDLMDDDFVAGKMVFKGEGSVTNLGTITATGGDAILIGSTVINDGTLEAPEGIAGLAAGREILLQLEGSERIFIKPSAAPASDQTGITHSGLIEALQAEIKADGNLYALAICSEGRVNAGHITKQDGRIFLTSSEGLAQIKGQLKASGGEITIAGKYIDIQDGALVDTSDLNGGGSIEITNADVIRIEQGGLIHADATQNGDGGSIVIVAEKATLFYGEASAQGGPQGGNGGFVEVSGREFIDTTGPITTLAPKGISGTLLIDPYSLTIDDAPANTNVTLYNPGPNIVYNSTGTPANIKPAQIQTYLSANQTVQIQTYGASPQGMQSGDITIQSSSGGGTFTFNANGPNFARQLILQANGSIFVGTGATPTNIAFTNGGSFIFTSTNDLDVNGSITVTGLYTGGNAPQVSLTADVGNVNVNNSILMENGSIFLTAESSIGLMSFAPGGNVIIQGGPIGPAYVGVYNGTQTGVGYGTIGIDASGGVQVGTLTMANDVEVFSVNGGVILGLNSTIGDIVVQGGNGNHAQIGANIDTIATLGGPSTIDCDFSLFLDGNLYVLGDTTVGQGDGYAQIGHSGGSQPISSPNPSLEGGYTILCLGGGILQSTNNYAYAQIGSSPSTTQPTTLILDGAIMTFTKSVLLQAGGLKNSYSLIGNGGAYPTATTTYVGQTISPFPPAPMGLTLVAQSIELIGGTGPDSFAAIGIAGNPNATFGSALNLGVTATASVGVIGPPASAEINLIGGTGGDDNGAYIGIFLYADNTGTVTSTPIHSVSVGGSGYGTNITLEGNNGSITSAAAIGVDFASGATGNIGANVSVNSSDALDQFGSLMIDATNGSAFIQDGVGTFPTSTTNISFSDSIDLIGGSGTARINSLGTITALAGNNISITSTVSNNAFIQAATGLIVVTDNNYPFLPGIFFNGFTLDANSYLKTFNGSAIEIYTARYPQNHLLGGGLINGVHFSGTRFVNDPQNQYFVYYSAGTATAPYTVFYKEGNPQPTPPGPPVPPTPPVVLPPEVITFLGFEFEPFVLDYEDLYWEPGYYIAYEKLAPLHRPLWELFRFRQGMNQPPVYKENFTYTSYSFADEERFFLHKKKYLYYKGYL